MKKNMLERYEQAQILLQGSPASNKLIRNDTVFPHWIRCTDQSMSNCFWYRRQTVEGKEFRFVDADAASNVLAFDHHALANALSNALTTSKEAQEETSESTDSATKTTQEPIEPLDLPLTSVSIIMEKKGAPLQLHFQALNKYWFFNPNNSELEEATAPRADGTLSPDGKKIAFVRDYNIWIRDQSSGEEQALTKDGVEDCRYGHLTEQATPLWSADSQSILFTQLDEQKVRVISHINYGPTNNGSYYPEVTERKQSYPGDEYISSLQLYAVDIATGQLQKADYPPIPIRVCGPDGISGFFEAGLGWWSADNQRAFFIDTPRDSKIIRVVEWNIQSGVTRVVLEETDDITVRLRYENVCMPIIFPLPNTDELIWFSERSGWGHLYLYDLNSGKLKHQITGVADNSGGEPSADEETSANGEPSANGQWLVRNILHVDTEKRELLLQTAARNPAISPYYRDICKVNIDSGALTSLVEGNFDFAVNLPLECNSFFYKMFTSLGGDNPNGISSSGQYLVTTASRVDTVPVSTLIDRDGKEILTLETCDVSSLPSDWQWPEPVKLKGADDTTDIYAVVFRPPGFSPEKSYPVVDFLSSMRCISALPTGSFANNIWAGCDYMGAAALATLGFIVVTIVGRGTPHRDKAFYTHHYGDQAFTSDLTDRMAGLRQLAERYPYMDLERVGLSANENPSNNAIYGSLLYSDFYKVTAIHCMPDPRFWNSSMSEEFDIQMSPTALPKTPYPEDCVDTFNGKLLLIIGMGSWAMHQPTFLLADALKKANKDFDMLCIPDLHHAVCSYALRREWDYLVTHLQGGEPPKQFELIRSIDLLQFD